MMVCPSTIFEQISNYCVISGNDFPYLVYGGGSANYQNSFVYVGGSGHLANETDSDKRNLNSIY